MHGTHVWNFMFEEYIGKRTVSLFKALNIHRNCFLFTFTRTCSTSTHGRTHQYILYYMWMKRIAHNLREERNRMKKEEQKAKKNIAKKYILHAHKNWCILFFFVPVCVCVFFFNTVYLSFHFFCFCCYTYKPECIDFNVRCSLCRMHVWTC